MAAGPQVLPHHPQLGVLRQRRHHQLGAGGGGLTIDAVPTSPEVCEDLICRVIDNAYRSIAEKARQLYMKADEAGVSGITEMLDKPMRNASDDQQAFSGLLADLKLQAPSSAPPANAASGT
jgi:hypothetical protein